jgi:DNA repair protein RadC
MQKVKSLEDLVKKPLANSRRGVCYRIITDKILSDYDYYHAENINSATKMYDFIIEQLQEVNIFDKISVQEVGGFILLNSALKPIGFFAPFSGGINSAIIDIEIVVFSAISLLAKGVALFHSHPSGNPKPSDADFQVTTKLQTALSYFDIDLIDHVILTPNNLGQKFSTAMK